MDLLVRRADSCCLHQLMGHGCCIDLCKIYQDLINYILEMQNANLVASYHIIPLTDGYVVSLYS